MFRSPTLFNEPFVPSNRPDLQRPVFADIPTLQTSDTSDITVQKKHPDAGREETLLQSTIRSNSVEDATVLSNLVNEIIAMQQERTQRRRNKAVTTICREADKQLSSFLTSWRRYCEGMCVDDYQSCKAEAENVTQILTNLQESLTIQFNTQAQLEVDQARGVLSIQDSERQPVLTAFGGSW
eukprot:scaffold601_cov170-Ochromonas_danica.AAC.24